MSERTLIVLGTSSQVPTRYRNHNGYLLLWDGEGLLFDPGEGTQRQLIHAEASATSITRVLITHFHGDHCLGFAGITQRLSLDRVSHPVDVYFPASGQVFYDRLRAASIYYPFTTLQPRPIHEAGVIAEVPAFRLEARRLDHPVDTYGYRLQEPDGIRMLPERLAALGIAGPRVGELQRKGSLAVDGRTVRLEDVSAPKRGQAFAFVMDTRPCEGAVELARGVDLLVAESTYLESDAVDAHERGHMTAADAARVARDAGARLLVLTHFSQRYASTEPFLEEASAIFPNVVAAEDGQRIPLPPRRLGV